MSGGGKSKIGTMLREMCPDAFDFLSKYLDRGSCLGRENDTNFYFAHIYCGFVCGPTMKCNMPITFKPLFP
jgi:hypothetical protein